MFLHSDQAIYKPHPKSGVFIFCIALRFKYIIRGYETPCFDKMFFYGGYVIVKRCDSVGWKSAAPSDIKISGIAPDS
jgi:hypothetical protein